jgi:hypothetical protein
MIPFTTLSCVSRLEDDGRHHIMEFMVSKPRFLLSSFEAKVRLYYTLDTIGSVPWAYDILEPTKERKGNK